VCGGGKITSQWHGQIDFGYRRNERLVLIEHVHLVEDEQGRIFRWGVPERLDRIANDLGVGMGPSLYFSLQAAGYLVGSACSPLSWFVMTRHQPNLRLRQRSK
jgi:hypothetical protein